MAVNSGNQTFTSTHSEVFALRKLAKVGHERSSLVKGPFSWALRALPVVASIARLVTDMVTLMTAFLDAWLGNFTLVAGAGGDSLDQSVGAVVGLCTVPALLFRFLWP